MPLLASTSSKHKFANVPPTDVLGLSASLLKSILSICCDCMSMNITQSMQSVDSISLNQLKFLSHIVDDDSEGIKVDPKKTAVVRAWALPQNV